MNQYMDDLEYGMRNLTQEQIRHNYEMDRITWAREAKTRELTGATQPWNEAQMELNTCFLYMKLLHLKDQEVPIQVLRQRAGMNEERDAQRMKEILEEQAAERQRVIERVEKHRQLAEAKKQRREAEQQQGQAGAQERKQTETWRVMQQELEQQRVAGVQRRAAQKRAQDDQELEEKTNLLKMLDPDENKVQAEKYRIEKQNSPRFGLEQLLQQQRAAGVPQRTKLQRADEDTPLSEFDIRRIEKDIGDFRNNINAQDGDGNTALHLVARATDFYTARKLIAAGASRRILNNRGQTASDLATGYQDLSDFLKV
jgi:hypothetical protein